MIDARHLEIVERLVDIRRRAFFAGVGHREKAGCARAPEHFGELRWRVAELRGIEPHRTDGAAMRQRLLQRLLRRLRAQVAQKTQDQARSDSEPGPGLVETAADAVEDSFKRNAALGVCLRIEENLDMNHALRVHFFQIGQRHRAKIVFVAQHIGAFVVDIEEGLQVVEVVRLTQSFDGRIFQLHAVLAREREHHLRLQRAFDVKV